MWRACRFLAQPARSSSIQAACVSRSSAGDVTWRGWRRVASQQQQPQQHHHHHLRRWSSGTWVDSQGYEHFGKKPSLPWWSGTRAAVLAGVAGTAGFSYYWSCREQVPYTHRWHAIMMVSHAMENNMGQQTYQQVLQEAVSQHKLLPPHHRAVHMVKHVGMRIAQVAADGGGGGYSQHMRGLDWRFAVIDSPEVNAFVVPGGGVVVYTGLLRLMQTEDELAAVLAHEVGHVLARHHAERISQMNATGLVNLTLRLLLGVSIPGPLVMLGMFLPYSRAAEYEADAIGIHLLAKACYDPDANITMLQKLEAAQQKAGAEVPPELLSTHPLTQERVQRVRALLPEAYALRQQTCTNLQDVLGMLAEYVNEEVLPMGRLTVGPPSP